MLIKLDDLDRDELIDLIRVFEQEAKEDNAATQEIRRLCNAKPGESCMDAVRRVCAELESVKGKVII